MWARPLEKTPVNPEQDNVAPAVAKSAAAKRQPETGGPPAISAVGLAEAKPALPVSDAKAKSGLAAGKAATVETFPLAQSTASGTTTNTPPRAPTKTGVAATPPPHTHAVKAVQAGAVVPSDPSQIRWGLFLIALALLLGVFWLLSLFLLRARSAPESSLISRSLDQLER